MSNKILGVDIGATSIEFGAGDNSIDYRNEHLSEDYSDEELADLVEEEIGRSGLDIYAVGVGVPGIVDPEEKKITRAANIDELNFTEVENQLDVPLQIENDANAAVMGEKHYGDGENHDNLITVMIGSGVGSGIYYDNNLLRSMGDIRACESGFMNFGNASENYTWEDVCGGDSIPDRTTEFLENYNEETELEASMNGEKIFELADKGDEAAEEFVEQWVEFNAKGIGNLVNVLGPELITFGGSVALNNEKYIQESIERAEEYAVNPVPEMKVSNLGEDLGLYGAMGIASENIRNNE